MSLHSLKRLATLRTDLKDVSPRPYIALEHLDSWSGRLLPDVDLSQVEAPQTGAASVEPGNVLFGKLRPYLAKTLLVTEPSYASTELLALEPRPGVNSRWLAYLLQSRPVIEWAVATSEGTKMPRTSWERFAGYKVDVPAILEQGAVACFLDAETTRIDALISKKRQLLMVVEQRRRAHAAQLTCAGLTVELSASNCDIPKGWSILHLRRCLAQADYGIGVAAESAEGIAVLGMGNVDDHGGINGEPVGYVESVDPGLLLRTGDLLFNRTNSLAKVGKVGIVRELREPTTFASYLVRLRTNSIADPEYLNHLLNAPEVLGLIRSTALPSIGQANLNPSRYGELRIALPPLDFQREIRATLDSERRRIGGLTSRLEQQIGLLKERRQALITAAVTGNLKVPGAVP